ncbi:MAG TPA: PEP-CTERM sorting domain-containing protein [Dissulfurispiraceae bacterium]|nr:PEP-CTERM sorting domain-containing protein [Dissulfurispiraceae bacterium]
MKRLLSLACVVMLLFAVPAWAGFVNGGFEDGTFNGWTKDGGYWWGGSDYDYYGDQGSSAIMTAGTDTLSDNNLQKVLPGYGTYSARINDEDYGAVFSTLSQKVTWNEDAIYFAFAAVLEEPSNVHPAEAAPHFSITLTNVTTNTILYSKAYQVYGLDSSWKKGIIGGPNDEFAQWWYRNWEIVSLDTSAYKGNELLLTLLASDCGWGGHGGYAYLDGFGSVRPPDVGAIPEPSTYMLMAAGIAGLALFRKRFQK